MSKHAQGPWKTDGNITTRKVDGYETTAVAVSRADVAQAVALVYAGFGDGPSNARLIAAVPELLDACNGLLGLIQLVRANPECPENIAGHLLTSFRVKDALAAIAKATGEQR